MRKEKRMLDNIIQEIKGTNKRLLKRECLCLMKTNLVRKLNFPKVSKLISVSFQCVLFKNKELHLLENVAD